MAALDEGGAQELVRAANQLGRQGRFEESLDAASAAVAVEPSWPIGHKTRAAALSELGRFPEAAEALRLALILLDGDGKALVPEKNRDQVRSKMERMLAVLAEKRDAEGLGATPAMPELRRLLSDEGRKLLLEGASSDMSVPPPNITSTEASPTVAMTNAQLRVHWSSLPPPSEPVIQFYGHTSGRFACFSNFYEHEAFDFQIPACCRERCPGIPSRVPIYYTEKAVMLCKAALMGDQKSFDLILHATCPKDDKKLGRCESGRRQRGNLLGPLTHSAAAGVWMAGTKTSGNGQCAPSLWRS